MLRLIFLFWGFVLAGCASAEPSTGSRHYGWFAAVKRFESWSKTQTGEDTSYISPEIRVPFDADEAVLSWNIQSRGMGACRFEVMAVYPDHQSRWFCMGEWSADPRFALRSSVPQQRDADAEVQTDTLVLRRPAHRFRIRLTISGCDRTLPRFLGVSFSRKGAPTADLEKPYRAAWGREVPLVPRSQLAWPGGEVWCSPTCLNMVLRKWLPQKMHWVEPPDTAAAVYDPAWPGTGNWVFNTAHAGSFAGMRAYVARLGGLRDLEIWTAAGFPVVLSVSARLLRGEAAAEQGGHIVVCAGFTKSGDVVIYNPWARPDKGESVRRVVHRQWVQRAWDRSRRTVYLIYPEKARIPRSGQHLWEDR
jgi:hypothetical protein